MYHTSLRLRTVRNMPLKLGAAFRFFTPCYDIGKHFFSPAKTVLPDGGKNCSPVFGDEVLKTFPSKGYSLLGTSESKTDGKNGHDHSDGPRVFGGLYRLADVRGAANEIARGARNMTLLPVWYTAGLSRGPHIA